MKQEKFITLPKRDSVPETSIYTRVYTKTGKLGTRDVMIFIPGGPGNDHALYDSSKNSMADAFFPHVDIILFDPRGCGKSQKSAVEHCSLIHYIDDIESIRANFDIPSHQFIAFAQSYGSIAALGYAIKYANKLKKLALIGGVASSQFLIEAKQNLLHIGTKEQNLFFEQVLEGNIVNTAEEVAKLYEVLGPSYTYFNQPSESTPNISHSSNAELINFGFGNFLKKFDYRPKLSTISCETMILHGENDWIFDKKQSQIVKNGITNSKLIVYKKCGHLLWIDHWEKFVQDMLGFITSPIKR